MNFVSMNMDLNNFLHREKALEYLYSLPDNEENSDKESYDRANEDINTLMTTASDASLNSPSTTHIASCILSHLANELFRWICRCNYKKKLRLTERPILRII